MPLSWLLPGGVRPCLWIFRNTAIRQHMMIGTRANAAMSNQAAMWDVSRLKERKMLSSDGMRTRISARSLYTMVRPIGFLNHGATLV